MTDPLRLRPGLRADGAPGTAPTAAPSPVPHALPMPPLHRTLRFRAALVALALISGFFAVVMFNTQRALEQAALENSRAVARQIAQTLNLALAPHTSDLASLAVVTPYLQELISPDSDGLLYLVLLAEDGRVLTRTDAAPQPLPAVDTDLGPAWRRGVLHLEQPILLGNQSVGRLRYGLSSRLLRDAAQSLLRQNLLLYGAVLLVIVGVMVAAMRRLGRRLQALMDAGALLASGAYQTAAPTAGHDELGVLGRELNLMADAVRSRIAALEESRQRERSLNEALESRVSQRTAELQQANDHLSRTLDDLRRLQDGLVQSEKLASLGSLVAAVAHELNTPIGNALGVATAYGHKARDFGERARGRLQRQALEDFLQDSQDAALLLERNLNKASELITSFKHVAIDQTSSQRRRFDLAQTVGDVLATLSPTTRHHAIRIDNDVPGGLEMTSFPGPLGQVLTNLVNNALLHAFAPGQPGRIRVHAALQDADHVVIDFSDDGCGCDADTLKRIFDPFFTTRLGQGGSGLGMNIVHNIVTGLLQGRITLDSAPGQGLRARIVLPRVAQPVSSTTLGGLPTEALPVAPATAAPASGPASPPTATSP